MARQVTRVETLPSSHATSVLELSRLTQATNLDVLAEARKPHCRIWIATSCEGGPPEAYVLCWWVADELQVVDLATAPHARRRGLARALLGELIAFAKDSGIQALWLEVRSDNAPAIALYEACNFEHIRIRPRYYADGVDALEMACFVSASADR